MRRDWKNIPGRLYIELDVTDCDIKDAHSGRSIPMLRGVCTDDHHELIIEFTSSGCHVPASMYGGSDRMGWPEEYNDERVLVEARIDGLELSKDLQERLASHFEKEIYEVELEEDDA